MLGANASFALGQRRLQLGVAAEHYDAEDDESNGSFLASRDHSCGDSAVNGSNGPTVMKLPSSKFPPHAASRLAGLTEEPAMPEDEAVENPAFSASSASAAATAVAGGSGSSGSGSSEGVVVVAPEDGPVNEGDLSVVVLPQQDR